ncbi:MAG: sigma 54-interacting transcriptional regulator [Negativicutes bacterium]|nr:sigma 54-interacting transcriptional regulator [Negativicutes bacterium]MDR3588059.1 sigma 54-interacting transcriptional regulator [Negativicutes bacterium]
MTVRDYMTRQVVTITMESSISDAIRMLRKFKFKGIPVVNDDGRVCGMFTQKNLLYIIEDQISLDLPVKNVMHPDITFIDQDTPIEETCLYPRKRLPVLNKKGELMGILTKSDIIRGFKAKSTRVTQQLQAVLESTPHGIVAVDRDNRVVFVNPAAERMLAVKASQLTNRPFEEIIPECKMLRDQVLEKGQIIRNSKNTSNGCTYIANAAPIKDGAEIVGAVASLQPISDIELLADELNAVKQLNSELDAVIEFSYDGIFVTDENGKLLKINAACGKLLGMVPERVINHNAIDVASYHNLPACVTQKVLDKKKTYSVSYELNGKTVAVTGNPVFDEMGGVSKVISNVRDFTELASLRMELEQVNRLKEQYFSELSSLKVQVASNTGSFRSEAMKRIYDLAMRVAVVDTPILIQGESGVGKEVLANYIHQNSLRRENAFIKINCGAIPESLLESELFGYCEGAFTGAKKGGKPGMFEIANDGTLFLDEIGEIPLTTQVKLLRALQDQEIFKVGGEKSIRVDARLIFATNRDLEADVRAGKFREDLYYRINVVPITIPPLRERPVDIAILADTYLKKLNDKHRTAKKLSNEVLDLFNAYNWPGNVRELINILERLIITCPDDMITAQDLPCNILQQMPGKGPVELEQLLPLKSVMERIERDIVERSLRECKSMRHAARTLGLDPATFLRKVEKYKIRCNSLM